MDGGIDCLSIWPFSCSPATTALIAMVVGRVRYFGSPGHGYWVSLQRPANLKNNEPTDIRIFTGRS